MLYKRLRDDSVLRALSSLRGLRGAPAPPPLCRETSVSRTANVGTVGKNEMNNPTIASPQNVPGVIVGGLLGHFLCTGLAVMGGRVLAARISIRTGGFVLLCMTYKLFYQFRKIIFSSIIFIK